MGLLDVQHLNVKIFVKDPRTVHLEDFLSLFSDWIQKQACEELLIDVADYRHVAAGPGVLLIGHEANYSMDNGGNRLGLLYNRKAPMNGDVQGRLEQVVCSALLACRRIEDDPLVSEELKFEGQELEFLINDRLLAPNVEPTFVAFKPELEAFLGRLYPGVDCLLERNAEPRERLTIGVKAQGSFDVATLLRNLES